MNERSEHVETLVVGGGQAGLAQAYHLAQRDIPYLVVDANERIGDAWRKRWDSLRLFTPARLDGLPGMPFPGYRWSFPTKDEFADYLESYAEALGLNVRTGVRVERLTHDGRRFLATVAGQQIEADNVVVAMSSWQKPRIPEFATEIDPDVVQIHVADYRNPDQLPVGDVLVVGAGNSGAEVAKELARTRHVTLGGPSTGALPVRPEGVLARVLMPFVGRVVFHRVLTTSTPIGRKARPKMIASGEPLIRVKPRDLEALGVERVPRVTGVADGRPQLEDGRKLDVASIVWCSGFRPGFDWIDLPEFAVGPSAHRRGIVDDPAGLYFLGQKFLYSVSSEQIHGVGRDAAYLADHIARSRTDRSRVDGERAPEPVPERR
ncbi:MAG: flavin-containing monooxygenase [Acidimicrobiia bacterium]